MTILITPTATARDDNRQDSAPRPAVAERTEQAAAPIRPEGSYTSRYDSAAETRRTPRSRGNYVTAASQRTRPAGSYTCTDGASAPRRARGSYTFQA
ncbi:hypothetical protein LJ756_02780 [Arthrobacter sp. zg-Y411]|uniref:hypothetical protein n=1 Tax=Arthrobacter zhangbolii TaxID=2886936 RepID=UPI001D14EB7D|nr:hypothetical protein [Arthrobacter zhangbolii]MCC3293547.1 hypothetical protein [Arthrobacter zhangbolii]